MTTTTHLNALVAAIMTAPNREAIRTMIQAYLQERDKETFSPIKRDDFTEMLDAHTRYMEVSAQSFDVTPADDQEATRP